MGVAPSRGILGSSTVDFQPIIIAVFGARRIREMSDYVLAERWMSSFMSALSASSSTTSGWAMLVFPALADRAPVDDGEHRRLMLTGVVGAIPAAITVALLTSPPSAEVMGQFDRVNARALAVP